MVEGFPLMDRPLGAMTSAGGRREAHLTLFSSDQGDATVEHGGRISPTLRCMASMVVTIPPLFARFPATGEEDCEHRTPFPRPLRLLRGPGNCCMSAMVEEFPPFSHPASASWKDFPPNPVLLAPMVEEFPLS